MPYKLRTKKVFCGGHSLGGPLTTAFAGWDFDGNPSTTKDAGYNQCAAFFALDTRLSLSTKGRGVRRRALERGTRRRVRAGERRVAVRERAAVHAGDDPGSLPTALAAFQQPHDLSHVTEMLPQDPNFNVTFRTLFSRDPANAATQMPSIRDFRVTNEVALAATFDDNSSPVTILRTSLGTFAGGPVAQKSWPAPYGQTTPGGLIDGKHLMIPTAAKGPLYRWWRFNQFGKPGTPVQRDDSGTPFTSAASEVTDVHQFARSIFEAPADFAEQYFPLRLLSEQQDASNGDRSGSLQNLRYDGIPKHPQFYADAQHGIEDGASPPPKGPGPSAWIKLPGYDHIDVATAALRQNNGKPEAESAGLWTFASKALKAQGKRQQRTGAAARVGHSRQRVAAPIGRRLRVVGAIGHQTPSSIYRRCVAQPRLPS